MLIGQVLVDKKPRLSYAFIAFILWAFFFASSAPTPLYQVYQHEWGFTSITLTVIFSVYAMGMLAALLIVGSLSDFLGRKPVAACAIALEIISMVVFLQASEVGNLIIARFIQGFATGMATTVLGAFLLDINSERAAISNSVYPLMGVGAGVMISSAIVDFGPTPLKFIYFLILGVLIVQFLVVYFLDEPITRRSGALQSLKPSLGVPASARSMFTVILPMNTAVWSLNGFFLALVPSLVRLATSSNFAITGGAVVGGLSICSAISVVLLKHKSSEYSLRVGASLLALGVCGILFGVYTGLVYVFYVATMAAGFGAGASFISFTRSLFPLASPSERASLISAYYVVSQLSLIIPSVTVGYLITVIGLPNATYCYGVVVLLLLAISVYLMEIQSEPAR